MTRVPTPLMASRASAGTSLTLVTVLIALMVATSWWRASVFRTERAEVKDEPWDHVKQEYPLPPEVPAQPKLSAETVEAIVRANPFSPQRRQIPPSDHGGAEANPDGSSVPPPPRFAYKGRIHMGQRQRAIIEEMTAHKTYFLEVGQEVAGFKVLDITETQVVLSDPQTHEAVAVSLSAKTPTTPPSGTSRKAGTP